ncbi:MAG: hypothetical protein HYS18_09385 [Burkholderiales bacterium]|nr:hypothetical protein [Burkholderiales bacterium]
MKDEMPSKHVPPQETKPSASSSSATDKGTQPTAPNIKLLMPWIAQLPPEIRPHELIVHYARIANKLAELWKRPAACEKYLNELMIDERGDRQGFPPAVAAELAVLNVYYTTKVITQHFTVWGDRVGDNIK